MRHGQSRWNEAQKNRRLEKMVAFDHPLTRQGAEEAEALNKRWNAARMAANGVRCTLRATPGTGGLRCA